MAANDFDCLPMTIEDWKLLSTRGRPPDNTYRDYLEREDHLSFVVKGPKGIDGPSGGSQKIVGHLLGGYTAEMDSKWGYIRYLHANVKAIPKGVIWRLMSMFCMKADRLKIPVVFIIVPENNLEEMLPTLNQTGFVSLAGRFLQDGEHGRKFQRMRNILFDENGVVVIPPGESEDKQLKLYP